MVDLLLCAGGFGHKDDNFVEYDLDARDKEWLEKFNGGQDKLPARRFELLIWRLELINAEANERHTTATGLSACFVVGYPCSNCIQFIAIAMHKSGSVRAAADLRAVSISSCLLCMVDVGFKISDDREVVGCRQQCAGAHQPRLCGPDWEPEEG